MIPIPEILSENRLSFAYLWPEMILILGVMGLLLQDVIIRHMGERQKPIQTLSALAVVAVAIAALLLGPGPETQVSLFNGLMVADGFSWFFRLFALGVALLVIPMVPQSGQIATARMGEFYALMLSITLGLMLLPGATDLLMIFLALELVSLISYVLTGYRKDVRISAEGALKYVIFGGVASGTMLYGFSLLYGLTGGTTLTAIHEGFQQMGMGGPLVVKVTAATAVVFVLVGFGYKIAAAPFHMWTPDAYEGAPTPFTAFLSVGPKAAGVAVMIRFFFGVFTEPTAWAAGTVELVSDLPWPEILAILSIATMTVGNLTALTQTNLKRMLAFSSIAHAGYMLMGLAAVSTLGLKSVVIYAVIYLFMNLGAFGLVTALGRKVGEEVDDYRGLAARAPLVALAMAAFLFSLTGLPPLAGFIGKVYVFYAVIEKGGSLMWALVLIGSLNGAISLFYYARVVKAMYLDKAVETSPVSVGPVYGFMTAAFLIPTLVLGVYWTPAVDAGNSALRSPLLPVGPTATQVAARAQADAAELAARAQAEAAAEALLREQEATAGPRAEAALSDSSPTL